MRKTAFITLFLGLLLAGCYKDSNFDASKLSGTDSTVQMFLDIDKIPADSFTVSRVLVELPYNADSTKTTVSFQTDLGFFVETGTQTATIQAKQNADSLKRIAIATLHSGTRTGIAHIKISIYTQTRILTDTLINSFPDYIQFSASTLSVKPANDATGEVGLTCKLFKFQGSPSQQNVVDLRVLDSTSTIPYGSFRIYNNLSDATSSTQFTYVLGDSTTPNKINYIGPLHALVAVAKDAAGDSLRSQITIYAEK
jgi:hypothetical protein